MNTVLQEDYCSLASRLDARLAALEGAHLLVTGAAGFIGRYLCGFLNFLNAEVLRTPLTADLLDTFVLGGTASAAVPGELHVRFGDASKRITLSRNPDFIVHMAGIASPNHYSRLPVQTLEAGTTGTRRMLELARHHTCRGMLFFSSSEVYGDPDPARVPTPETYNGNVSTSGPRACYDESKRLGETWSFLYAREFGVPVNIVRLFNAYGPGFAPSDGRVVPAFIESACSGRSLAVHDAGRQTRTFCYIADTLDALCRILLSQAKGEAFNIGSAGPEMSIRELAEMIATLLPQRATVISGDPELSVYSIDNPRRRCPDISKLRATTGYAPMYSLRAGLERTIRWYGEEHGARLHASRIAVNAL